MSLRLKVIPFFYARAAQAVHFTLAEKCVFAYAPTEKDRIIYLVAFGHLVYNFGTDCAVNYAVLVNASEIVE